MHLSLSRTKYLLLALVIAAFVIAVIVASFVRNPSLFHMVYMYPHAMYPYSSASEPNIRVRWP